MEQQQHGENERHAIGKKADLVTLRLKKKHLVVFGVIILFLVLGYTCKGLFIAAMVDGSPISRLAVIHELESISGKQALDSLIAEKLIFAEAQKRGVAVTDQELNDEVAKIADQIKSQQGGTLNDALAAQGLALATLKRQLTIQKLLEKFVADQVAVTDSDADQFLAQNKVAVPAGKVAEYRTTAKTQLSSQKLNAAKADFVKSLRAHAQVSIFKNYP